MFKKKWKNKALILLLIAFFSFSVAGCGVPEPAPENNNDVAVADPDEVYHWTLQGFTPEGTLFQDWTHDWANLVETLSHGRIQIDVHPPGSIVPSLEGIYAVRDGVLDVHLGYSGMWIGHDIAAPLFCSVPGMIGPLDMAQWLYQGGGIELYQELMDEVNAKVIPAGIIGTEIFLWADEPLKSIDDYRGKTLRMMPLMGEIIQEFGREYGIAVEFLPAAEVIPALERGVVDAAEYSIPAFDETLGFHDVANYFHYPGIHQPTGVLEVLISQDRWDELPEDLQEIVHIASETNMLRTWMEGERMNIETLRRFEEAGVQKVILDEETVEIFMDWSDQWFEAASQEHEFLGRVRQSQVEFVKEWYTYRDNTELPFPDWSLQE